MCFSASASFGASAVLATAGIASVRRVQKPSQLFLGIVPIIFSLQQLTEGFVWIGLSNHYSWQHIPILVFLFIAQVLWPVWVPLSVFFVESNERHKKLLGVLLAMGATLAVYLGYCLFFYKADALIIPYHIHYELYFPQQYTTIVAIVYFFTTIIPPFLSTQKRMALLGIFNLVSFMIAVLFFDDNIVSVWCFFSALISWQVFLIMKNLQDVPPAEPKIEGETVAGLNRLHN